MAMGFCVELSTFTCESDNCYQSIKITVASSVKRKTLSSLRSSSLVSLVKKTTPFQYFENLRKISLDLHKNIVANRNVEVKENHKLSYLHFAK